MLNVLTVGSYKSFSNVNDQVAKYLVQKFQLNLVCDLHLFVYGIEQAALSENVFYLLEITDFTTHTEDPLRNKSL